VGPLSLVESQGAGHGSDDGVGHCASVAALQPNVVVDTHAGEQRDLFATGGEEVAELGTGGHGYHGKPVIALPEGFCWYLE
jgi:hypothetical protein